MSGRDPIRALMKRAGLSAKNELTRHPEKAQIVAERFHAVAELLEGGDIIAAGVATGQALALLEVVDALWKQDRIEELRDAKCEAKVDAEAKWKALLSPSEYDAKRLDKYYRERSFNHFRLHPPYKETPPPPKVKEPGAGLRYDSVLEANDPVLAEQYGLPLSFEFKHGVSKGRGFQLSLRDAIERKLKHTYGDNWSVTTAWRPLQGADNYSKHYTSMHLHKNFYEKHKWKSWELSYHLVSSSHPDGLKDADELNGRGFKAKARARKKAKAA